MKRVLITGMSGTGKSTTISELAARGYRAVDLDQPGWSEWGDAERLAGVPEAEGGREWLWREDRVRDLLAEDGDGVLFVSGCSSNQARFYPRFDHIILLSAPEVVMRDRLATRTTTSFGKRPDELAKIFDDRRAVEPLLRRTAGLEVDTSAPLDEVLATILRFVLPTPV